MRQQNNFIHNVQLEEAKEFKQNDAAICLESILFVKTTEAFGLPFLKSRIPEGNTSLAAYLFWRNQHTLCGA